MVKKIVALGPESTGKSTLCTQLAAHYQTAWCPEFAREYLLQLNRPYSYADLLHIARQQAQTEAAYAAAAQRAGHPLLFIDTNQYVMKVWCEVVFNNCHSWILKQAAESHYHLYLLCDVDLPWVADELREYPDLEVREKLFRMYQDIVLNDNTAWVRITGTDSQRLQLAIAAVDQLINKP